MMSMNISPPRLSAARKLASTPVVKARILNSWSRNIGSGDLGLDDAEGDQQDHADDRARRAPRIGPAHGVVPVGLDPVGDPDHDQDETDREGDVAGPVDAGRPALAQLAQLEVAEDGAEQADRAPTPGR